jgi:RNA polymerase II subunit A small phosphatase-like protein
VALPAASSHYDAATTKNYSSPGPLLFPLSSEHRGRKTLVLDLDETLVHSSFVAMQGADYIVSVEIENVTHKIYVCKRPHVDEFLAEVGKWYECIVYTASLSKYANPVMDFLDPKSSCTGRLFRESCCNHFGNYVKDLSRLGRELAHTMIIDNSPPSYFFHPENAIPILSWFDDPEDTALRDLIPVLKALASPDVPDVRKELEKLYPQK